MLYYITHCLYFVLLSCLSPFKPCNHVKIKDNGQLIAGCFLFIFNTGIITLLLLYPESLYKNNIVDIDNNLVRPFIVSSMLFTLILQDIVYLIHLLDGKDNDIVIYRYPYLYILADTLCCVLSIIILQNVGYINVLVTRVILSALYIVRPILVDWKKYYSI